MVCPAEGHILSSPTHMNQTTPWESMPIRNISYDDVLELIDEIESGTIAEYSPEELQRVNQFLALLAQQGILPQEEGLSRFILNYDILTLLQPYHSFEPGYYIEGSRNAILGTFYGDADAALCRSAIKKMWDSTRHFVKKHKKEILIGGAIVVGVAATVTVIVLTCGTGAGAAVAVAEAVAGITQLENDSPPPQSPPEPPSMPIELNISMEPPPVITPIPETPLLQETIENQVAAFKETVFENIMSSVESKAPVESPSFLQGIRDTGAFFVHQALDGLTSIVADIPRLEQEIIDLTHRFVPPSMDNPFYLINLPHQFEQQKASGHQLVDRVFGTDQAKLYTQEVKEARTAGLTYGTLPPPGLFAGPTVANEGRLVISLCNKTRGWTVGDPIQNLTFWGNTPKWTTVRQRYWKNEAFKAKSDPTHRYRDQINRMEKGLAPQIENRNTGKLESMELHHDPSQREGGLFNFIEVTPEEHARLDPHRFINE